MKSKYTKDNSDIRDQTSGVSLQVSVLSLQILGVRAWICESLIRPGFAGLWMPDRVRHDKSVSSAVDYYPLPPMGYSPFAGGELL
jgi:hypothetical protein